MIRSLAALAPAAATQQTARISPAEIHRKPDRWTAADIAAYLDRGLELFGPGRLMFGRDWPVANLRGGYGKVWRETNLALARLSNDERDRILGGTAVAFYRLPVSAPPLQ
jgi:L-fuconolactonase